MEFFKKLLHPVNVNKGEAPEKPLQPISPEDQKKIDLYGTTNEDDIRAMVEEGFRSGKNR
jgi:hypothetical protein